MVKFTGNPITDDSALGGSVIERSLRFNDDDSTYLNRTPSSSSNRKTFTISWWFKIGNLGTGSSSSARAFFGAYDNSTSSNDGYYFSSSLGSDDKLYFGAWTQNWRGTNRVFRDLSAWYHCVVSVDTTQSTAADRVKIYINGVEETSFSVSNNPSQYYDLGWNFSSQLHTIGRVNYLTGSGPYSFDGYIAEFNSVDGQQLDPTHFGYTESQTGLWRPKKFIPTGPNNGATWSSTTQFDANVFDGDYTDFFLAQVSNGYYTATTSPFTIKQSLGVITGDGYNWGARFNGSTEVTTGNLSNLMGHNPDTRIVNFDLSGVTLPFDVTNLQLKAGTGSSGSTNLYGIVVDGVVLIDGDISNIGLNGFHLEFKDNSSTSALGKDTSNNRNDFTPNNFSVSAGAGNDSLEDTPTNNFCILNPLAAIATGNVTLSNGSLDASFGTVSGGGGVVGTFAVSSGKWYWETTITAASGSARITIGVVDDTFATYSGGVFYEPGLTSASYGYVNSGTKYNNNSDTSYGASYTTNDVIGVALDLDKGTITFYKNNSSQGQAFSGLTGGFLPAIGDGSSAATHSTVSNFGQRAFAYTPPSGFKALSTKNLPPNTPSIIRPQKHFDTILYTGNSSSGGSGTSQSISGLEFKPDFIWIKNRDATYYHHLADTVRGISRGINSNANDAENNYNNITAVHEHGFNVGAAELVNKSGQNLVAWCWKAGGAAVSNTNGNITSSVSVNEEAGFSIVSYTGNGSNGQTVGHGLSQAPQWIMLKARDATQNWRVWHHKLAADGSKRLLLDATNVSENAGFLNDTAPTSTVFTLGNADDAWNANGDKFIVYCWHEVPGFSKFGSYTGNGRVDGSYVHLGFRPAWIMLKSSNLTVGWYMIDNKRDTDNPVSRYLKADTTSSEDNDEFVDFLSSGFKHRYTDSSGNGNGDTYIYMAFAEQPGTTPFDTFPNAR